MTAVINVVSLSTAPGIGVLTVTAGLGGLAGGGVALPSSGGGRNTRETWWFRTPWTDDEGERALAWELGIDLGSHYRRRVSFEAFESRAIGILEEQARSDRFMSDALAIMRREEERKQRLVKIAKVTVTVAGVSYVLWRLLPFL